MNDTFAYLKSFFNDKDVASVTPTSRWCMSRVCAPIDFTEDNLIVEYGAGAGVYAHHLLPRMTPDSRLIMFETNELLYRQLCQIDDPRVESHQRSVEFVDEVLEDSLAGQVDYIISGIPFSFLDKPIRKKILETSRNILRPGGQFLAYQTSGHLKEPLRQTFGNVHTTWEWRNLPPMTVYRAVKK